MAANFKILSQKQGTAINSQGSGFEDVWTITYQVTDGPSKGTIGTISVPEEDHNAAFISDTITDKVTALDEVASL
jgi:uncharacterized membrane protein